MLNILKKYLNLNTLIELIWTITPALILILISFPSIKLLYLIDEVTDPSMSVLVDGEQWYLSYQYPDFLNHDSEYLEFDCCLPKDTEPTLMMMQQDTGTGNYTGAGTSSGTGFVSPGDTGRGFITRGGSPGGTPRGSFNSFDSYNDNQAIAPYRGCWYEPIYNMIKDYRGYITYTSNSTIDDYTNVKNLPPATPDQKMILHDFIAKCRQELIEDEDVKVPRAHNLLNYYAEKRDDNQAYYLSLILKKELSSSELTSNSSHLLANGDATKAIWNRMHIGHNSLLMKALRAER